MSVFLWLMAALSTLFAVSASSPAWALTPPIAGAVNLPSGASLTLPFPDGTPVRASCGYGPNCSPYHDGTNDACCTNDYYALDLVRDVAGGGAGLPVLATAAGTVVAADWASGGWSTFGRMVLIAHDFGDGHTYLSLYAHLSSWSVSVGDVVQPKDEIGTMGGSGNYVDGYFASHLHYSLYRDASFLGGPYGGNATVPEPIDGYEDLYTGIVLTAGPGGEGSASIVVDDEDPGFTLVGDASAWTSGGYRGHFLYAPSAASPTTVGTWTPAVTETGLYTVSAFIPYSNYATATRAAFTIHAQGASATGTQDQSIIGGAFHPLFDGDAFKLVAGGRAFVALDDGTGEGSGAYVAWDALKFDRIGDAGAASVGDACASPVDCEGALVCDLGTCREPCDVSGCGPGGTCDAATGLCDVWPDDGAGTTTAFPGAGPGGTTGDGTTGDGTAGDSTVPGDPSEPHVFPSIGCATNPGGAPLGGFVLLAAAALAGRRRPCDAPVRTGSARTHMREDTMKTKTGVRAGGGVDSGGTGA